MGNYSALAEQFLRKRDKPIHSIGQGLVEAGADIAEGFILKNAREKDAEREAATNNQLAAAYQKASNPYLTQYEARASAGQPVKIDGASVFGAPANTTERYGAGMAQIKEPGAYVKASPDIMEMAKQFAPKEKEYLAPMGATGPDGKPIMIRPEKNGPGVAPVVGYSPELPEILRPGVKDARKEVAAEGRPVTNINTKGETKYVETRSEDYAKQASAYQNAGRNATKKLGQLSVLNSALSDPAVYQGTAGPAVTGVKRGLKTLFGVDIEGVGPAELASRVGGEMALALKENLPGPMSDGDRKFLMELPPGLTNSREGNMLLVDYHQRMAKREMEIAELAREYESAVGQLDVGFDDVLADFAEQNPIFSEEDFKKAASLAGATAQPSPLAGSEALLREADAIAAGALGAK